MAVLSHQSVTTDGSGRERAEQIEVYRYQDHIIEKHHKKRGDILDHLRPTMEVEVAAEVEVAPRPLVSVTSEKKIYN